MTNDTNDQQRPTTNDATTPTTNNDQRQPTTPTANNDTNNDQRPTTPTTPRYEHLLSTHNTSALLTVSSKLWKWAVPL